MSFCPTCYDSSPHHQSRRVSCSDCGSYTHIQCADGDESSSTHYLCPPCRDPISFSFFRPFVDTDGVPCLDKSLSEAFLCACKIAAFSMNRAVCAFKMEAERKGKEGAVEKKRAREALEYFVKLYEKARSDVDKLREASFEQYPAVQVKQEE